jgi:hypothetical protein
MMNGTYGSNTTGKIFVVMQLPFESLILQWQKAGFFENELDLHVSLV